jgi:Spy/CpxP family protein refolding chaperone
MIRRACMIVVEVIAALAIAAVAYAHGPGAGSWSGSTTGGVVYAMMGGQGMMGGGQGGGMSGYGQQGGSNLWDQLTRMFDGSNQQSYRETEGLRMEIQEKRRELAALYRSDKPDKSLIDKKIEELNRLEAELDRETAVSEQRQPTPNRGWNGMGY